jgi:hypothetical protein
MPALADAGMVVKPWNAAPIISPVPICQCLAAPQWSCDGMEVVADRVPLIAVAYGRPSRRSSIFVVKTQLLAFMRSS